MHKFAVLYATREKDKVGVLIQNIVVVEHYHIYRR